MKEEATFLHNAFFQSPLLAKAMLGRKPVLRIDLPGGWGERGSEGNVKRLFGTFWPASETNGEH